MCHESLLFVSTLLCDIFGKDVFILLGTITKIKKAVCGDHGRLSVYPSPIQYQQNTSSK